VLSQHLNTFYNYLNIVCMFIFCGLERVFRVLSQRSAKDMDYFYKLSVPYFPANENCIHFNPGNMVTVILLKIICRSHVVSFVMCNVALFC